MKIRQLNRKRGNLKRGREHLGWQRDAWISHATI
jgi:hypothetical protein